MIKPFNNPIPLIFNTQKAWFLSTRTRWQGPGGGWSRPRFLGCISINRLRMRSQKLHYGFWYPKMGEFLPDLWPFEHFEDVFFFFPSSKTYNLLSVFFPQFMVLFSQWNWPSMIASSSCWRPVVLGWSEFFGSSQGGAAQDSNQVASGKRLQFSILRMAQS